MLDRVFEEGEEKEWEREDGNCVTTSIQFAEVAVTNQKFAPRRSPSFYCLLESPLRTVDYLVLWILPGESAVRST